MKRTRDDQPGPGPAKRPGGPAKASQAGSSVGGYPSQMSSKLTTNDALSYLREVKNRFSDNKEVYDTFLEIMKEFKAQRIDTAGVIIRVKQLFKGHKELILGFNTFLPKGYEIELARELSEDEQEEEQQKQPVEFDQAINYVNKIKTRFFNDERVYKAFLEILNMYRKGQKSINNVYEEVAVLFRNHQDLLDEFTYFLPDNTPPVQGAMPRKPGVFYSGGRLPPGGRVQPPMGKVPQPPLSPSDPRSLHKRKAGRRGEDGFRRYDDDEPRPKPTLQKELHFFEKVKARLRSREAYTDLLKCLSMYSSDIISRSELISVVGDIIGKFPDLTTGFHDFLAKCEMMDIDVGGMRMPGQQGGMPPATQQQQRDMLKQKQLQRDKFLTKPLSEIVANETDRITPSYVKMPVGYPRLSCSGRTPLAMSVLNDQYINVITGSEDYSFKLMRKNQYEESLFRCEDDRYDFEMCIETNASTIRRLRPLKDKIDSLSPEERASFRLEDKALGPVHTRAIERLYADQGPVLMDLLRKNPVVAIPIVLNRLEQKDVEWRRVKEDMTKTWRRIYEANYHKSLDHRSFYFKQAEKKMLLPKTLVAEVKEAAEKRRHEERYLRSLSLAARYETATATDLTYDYSERAIFEDCYAILRTAIDQYVAGPLREAVIDLYLRLVEPFFGLQERSDELARVKAEHTEGKASGDADMADTKSDSSEPDAKGEQNRETPLPETTATPELGAEGRGPQPDASVADTAATDNDDKDAMDEDTSADVGAKTERDVADLGEESCDEHPGRATTACRPIMPYTGSSGQASAAEVPSNTHVLFCNESMYIFFRFHRFLFDRLWTARKCCAQKFEVKPQTSGFSQIKSEGDSSTDQASEASQAAAAAQAKEEADKLHATFMAMVQRLLTGEMEMSVFEDAVRAALGTNSYELFTLDKLIQKIIKHMQSMVTDDQTVKLWELYRYESSRGSPVNTTVYHINVHALLDEPCYKVELAKGSAQLSVMLLDQERLDGFVGTEGYLTDYIRRYVSTPTPGQQDHLFLRRNLGQRARHMPDVELVELLKTLHVHNGLECKISCATSKVSYVLDTEDVMCRRKIRSGSQSSKRRRSRLFNEWLTELVVRLTMSDEVSDNVMAKATAAAAQAKAERKMLDAWNARTGGGEAA